MGGVIKRAVPETGPRGKLVTVLSQRFEWKEWEGVAAAKMTALHSSQTNPDV